MEFKAPAYLGLIERNFNDKDVDTLIEHFRDPERRKEFFKEYKEIEMLYEIISPDAFLRPFIDDYATLSNIYLVVRNAYTRGVYVDRDFQKKTNALVQKHIGESLAEPAAEYVVIDRSTIETPTLLDAAPGGQQNAPPQQESPCRPAIHASSLNPSDSGLASYQIHSKSNLSKHPPLEHPPEIQLPRRRPHPQCRASRQGHR
jgi:hypothetical protein